MLGASFVDPNLERFTKPEVLIELLSSFEKLPVPVVIGAVFMFYVIGEVVLFLPRSLRQFVGLTNEEDQMLVAIAKTSDAFLISEFQSLRQRNELFEAFGFLLLMFAGLELCFSVLRWTDFSWSFFLNNIWLGTLMIRSVSMERRRFSAIFQNYIGTSK